MNNKGQTMFLAVLVAVMIFAFGMIVVNFLMPDVDTARVALDCTNLNITDGAKIACLGVDSVIIYFIILILSVAGGIITQRLLL